MCLPSVHLPVCLFCIISLWTLILLMLLYLDWDNILQANDWFVLFCEKVLWRKFVNALSNLMYSCFMLFGVDCFWERCSVWLWKLKVIYHLKLFKLLCVTCMPITRSDFSFKAWCYFSKKLNILMDSLWKNVTNKWLRNWSAILIIVFVATPGGGYSPVQTLFSLETHMGQI